MTNKSMDNRKTKTKGSSAIDVAYEVSIGDTSLMYKPREGAGGLTIETGALQKLVTDMDRSYETSGTLAGVAFDDGFVDFHEYIPDKHITRLRNSVERSAPQKER